MKKIEERRRFIRLEVPLELKFIAEGDRLRREVTTKNLSCEGLRFISEYPIKEGASLELNLNIPNANNPVHMKGKVIWLKRLTTADSSPFEVGIEFTYIEEDNKNTFLKYLCDLIYSQTEMMGHNQQQRKQS